VVYVTTNSFNNSNFNNNFHKGLNMSESDFDKDDLVLQELKSQNIEGLTPRGRLAIRELADQNQGAAIFVLLSMNSRIRELEKQLAGVKFNGEMH
jgi:hypothetical protein